MAWRAPFRSGHRAARHSAASSAVTPRLTLLLSRGTSSRRRELTRTAHSAPGCNRGTPRDRAGRPARGSHRRPQRGGAASPLRQDPLLSRGSTPGEPRARTRQADRTTRDRAERPAGTSSTSSSTTGSARVRASPSPSSRHVEQAGLSEPAERDGGRPGRLPRRSFSSDDIHEIADPVGVEVVEARRDPARDENRIDSR